MTDNASMLARLRDKKKLVCSCASGCANLLTVVLELRRLVASCPWVFGMQTYTHRHSDELFGGCLDKGDYKPLSSGIFACLHWSQSHYSLLPAYYGLESLRNLRQGLQTKQYEAPGCDILTGVRKGAARARIAM